MLQYVHNVHIFYIFSATLDYIDLLKKNECHNTTFSHYWTFNDNETFLQFAEKDLAIVKAPRLYFYKSVIVTYMLVNNKTSIIC